MLAYLLDENISPVIAEQLRAKNEQISVFSVHHWQGRTLMGQTDVHVLQAVMREGLVLVTYDLKTIPNLLSALAAESEDHAGVLFVDDATIRSNDYGSLVRALLEHWQRYHTENWINRIAFLSPASR